MVNSDDEPLSSESDMPSESELLPLLSDVLQESFSGIRIVHHNIQGLLSKSTDLCVWLGSCVQSASVFVFLKPGLSLEALD